jgi:adenosylhomocysteine nucleosidase
MDHMLDITMNASGSGTSTTGHSGRPDGVADDTRNLRIIAVTGLTFEARIVAGPDIAVICGGGPARLERSLEAAIRQGGAGVLSFGIAGGLAPRLKPGSCVIARQIIADSRRYPCDVGWSRSLMGLALGTSAQGDLAMSPQRHDVCFADIAGSDVPLADVRAKQQLHQATGAAVVDMESHVAARIAAARGVPFAAFRVVTDPARSALPPAALVATTPDGAIDVAAVIRSLFRHPKQVPSLIQLALDSWSARQALVRSRRRFGSRLGLTHVRERFLDVV